MSQALIQFHLQPQYTLGILNLTSTISYGTDPEFLVDL